jgi:signal transduction histidine kinase
VKDVEALLQERADQLASLSALSGALARSASLEETYRAALRCVDETLAPDRASVLLFDPDGVLRFKAWDGLSDEYRSATEGHTPWSPETRDPSPVLVFDVGDEPALAELKEAITREGIRALGFFPLVGGGRLLGKFMVYYDSPHEFTASEVRLAHAIGTHIALEIVRRQTEDELRAYATRLEALNESEQRAREMAERQQAVTEALAQAMTLQEIAQVIVREGAAALGAAAGWIAAVDDERWQLVRLAALGYQPQLEAAYAVLPLDLDNPTVHAAKRGEAFWFETAEQVAERYPSLEGDYRDTGFQAMAIVPVAAGDRRAGVIALNFLREKQFAGDEKRLLRALAAQCGQALERARLYATLQERADAASVLAHVGDGVFQLDVSERVIFWNRGAEVITDIAERDAVGKRVSELFDGWEEIRPEISITTVPLAIGRRPALPARVHERDLWLAISGVATGDGIVYAFRDVTDAERLERARRDFLSTISHELRTPLAGVYGATKTLLHGTLDTGTTRSLLRVIESESERLTHILDEMLSASRLDEGRVELDLRRCDAVTIAHDVIELQRARDPEGIAFRLESESHLPALVCDPVKLRQVLLNLLDNAIKYSPTGGEILVSLAQHGDVLRLSVSDHGLGVPIAERERIFEKFYRLDPELSRGVGGTGLGLYISREFVRRMGGRIWVEGREGAGSTFFLELPLATG